jgi:uncharacterized membrane protein YkoI
MRRIATCFLGLAACACSDVGGGQAAGNGVLAEGPVTTVSSVNGETLPAPLRALAEKSVPGIVIAEAERKEREGRVYYDVEGRRPDGSAVELDVLQDGQEYKVVEIQRDIDWADAPAAARAAAKAQKGSFAPERVIESTQTDGSVIYELFAPGRKEEPAMEVRIANGKAEVLTERWQH